jgi:LysR family transcriptional regulator, chromosome initiation inhibitor
MSLLSPSLKAFWAVSEKGTVQEAARTIGLTQTGVTQRIRSLEKQLKTTLFIRSRKGMKLTSEGESLKMYVRQCLENEGMALSRIQKASLESHIRISISGPSSILRSRVIPAFTSSLNAFPKIRFQFDLSDTESNADKLRTGQCDFAILEHHDVSKEMDSKIIAPERYKLYTAFSWKRRPLLDILKNEAIIDFDTKDRMTISLLDKYKLTKHIQNERHFVNNTDALISMLQSGIGYSVLSEEFAKPLVDQKQIFCIEPDYFFDFKVALAWYPRPEMPLYFKTLIQKLK